MPQYILIFIIFQGVSGGHLNPAVSVALAISGKLKNIKLLPAYLIGQYLVAFVGAVVVFGIYHGSNRLNFIFKSPKRFLAFWDMFQTN